MKYQLLTHFNNWQMIFMKLISPVAHAHNDVDHFSVFFSFNDWT